MSASRRTKLSEIQQYALQIIMNRGVIDSSEFKRIYSQGLQKFQINDPTINHKEIHGLFIHEICDAIKIFSFDIIKG